jgi:hypothetical protein
VEASLGTHNQVDKYVLLCCCGTAPSCKPFLGFVGRWASAFLAHLDAPFERVFNLLPCRRRGGLERRPDRARRRSPSARLFNGEHRMMARPGQASRTLPFRAHFINQSRLPNSQLRIVRAVQCSLVPFRGCY